MTASTEERVGILEAQHGNTLAAVEKLAEKTEALDLKIDAKFDKLANRLPIWATVLFAVMSAAIGALASQV